MSICKPLFLRGMLLLLARTDAVVDSVVATMKERSPPQHSIILPQKPLPELYHVEKDKAFNGMNSKFNPDRSLYFNFDNQADPIPSFHYSCSQK
jgi:hypothetical protein